MIMAGRCIDAVRRRLTSWRGFLSFRLRLRSRMLHFKKGRSALRDQQLLAASPCSVHDPAAWMKYARQLAAPTREYQVDLWEVQVDLLTATPAHAGKSGTATRSTGVVNSRCPNSNCDMAAGLHASQASPLDLATKGSPTPCDRVDPRSTSHLATLVIRGAIVARTARSQLHRHTVSGVPMLVSVKMASSAVRTRRSWTW